MSRLTEYLPVEGVDPGETVNVHHCKQGRGNDRLYITRKDDGYLYYCHHCGFAGFQRADYVARSKAVPARKETVGDADYHDVHRAADDLGSWAGWAREWVGASGITDAELIRHGFRYLPVADRVMYPAYLGGTHLGYQARCRAGAGPKYLTYSKGLGQLVLGVGPAPSSKPCVLVEDALSAIRVGRQFPSVALFGTNLTEVRLAWLIENYDRFVVWLDDDNAEVRRNTRRLHRRLSLFGPCVTITGVGKDPKHCTDVEIGEIVRGI